MTNHPNRSRKYRGVEIVRTDSVCLNNGRKLYKLTGAVAKSAEVRPFLTTIEDAKWHIDTELDYNRIQI